MEYIIRITLAVLVSIGITAVLRHFNVDEHTVGWSSCLGSWIVLGSYDNIKALIKKD